MPWISATGARARSAIVSVMSTIKPPGGEDIFPGAEVSTGNWLGIENFCEPDNAFDHSVAFADAPRALWLGLSNMRHCVVLVDLASLCPIPMMALREARSSSREA
jgi:hypothetical protein